jgi:4-amino-4-deoxy-L-arabinose transferase-like glycosyltransferase
LILRIIPLAMVGGRFLEHENPSYYEMGLQLLRGERFAPYWPPGVPYYLMLAHKIFGDGLLVARASMLLIYVGFSFALYALAKEVSSRRAGNLATLLFALYPSYIRYAFNPSTDFPAAACLVAAVYLGIRIIRKSSSLLAGSLGLGLAALALVRPSSLLLVIVAPAYLYYRTRRCRIVLTTLLISVTLISAWLWKAYTMTGRFVMVNDANSQNFFLGNNRFTPLYNTSPDGPVKWDVPEEFTRTLEKLRSEPEIPDRTYRTIAVRHIVSRPDLFLLRTFNRFRMYFSFPIAQGELLTKMVHPGHMPAFTGAALTVFQLCFYWPIMLLAIVFIFNTRNSDYVASIAGAAILYAIPYWITFSQPRFNFPVVPLFAVLAVALLDSLARSGDDALLPVLHSPRRRYAMFFTLAFFAYTQMEWIGVVLSSKVS